MLPGIQESSAALKSMIAQYQEKSAQKTAAPQQIMPSVGDLLAGKTEKKDKAEDKSIFAAEKKDDEKKPDLKGMIGELNTIAAKKPINEVSDDKSDSLLEKKKIEFPDLFRGIDPRSSSEIRADKKEQKLQLTA